MMKQKNRIGLISSMAVVLFTLSSCEDVLEQEPFSEISEEQFWKDNEDANAGVAAIYDAMQKHYAVRYFQYGEFRSDNFINSETANDAAIQLVENSLQQNSGYSNWTDLYAMISRANLAIAKIQQIDGFDPQLLGEAYALRSYAYFDAVRVWGAVPVFTEPVNNAQEELSRPATDGQTILNEIVIPDMLRAEDLLTTPSSDFRFSRNGLWAYQASVYMWLKDYPKAKDRLDKIVNSNAYELVTTRKEWNDLFSNDSGNQVDPKIQEGPELIFSLFFSLDTGDNSGIYGEFYSGVPAYYISPLLENKWNEKFPTDSLAWVAKYPDPADLPKTFIKDQEGNDTDQLLFGDWRYYESRQEGAEIGEARVAKWNTSNYNPSLDNTDIVLYRYAGVLLMLAEAENQLGNTARALDLVNQIRTARQLPLVDTAEFNALSMAERENLILDERQLELLGEAKRFWDLQRTDRAVPLMQPINGQTQETLVFPYFFNHVRDNSQLEQLPQYQ